MPVAQFRVDRREGGKLVFQVVLFLVLRVQEHLQSLAPINCDTSSLAHNLGRSHDVIKNLVVDTGQSAAPGSNAHAGIVLTEVLVQHRTLRNQHHVPLVNLLLQLPNKSPLDLANTRPMLVGNGNHNSLDVASGLFHLHLLCGSNANVPQLSLDLRRRAHFDFEQSLGDLLFQFIGGRTLGLENLLTGVKHDNSEHGANAHSA
mmetsp:Transcript_56870/g.122106  ORF Transcript_56870/g.122106 Transcript_56870/m.122106 type:complete len:203 (-) Transcript_56870:9-617(-)